MWGDRPRLEADSVEWTGLSMAWNQWGMLYGPAVPSQSSFTVPQPQMPVHPRARFASLPVFPQPVYPMGRLRHQFEHQAVHSLGGRVMALTPRHAACQQRTAADLAPNQRPTGHKQELTLVPRLQADGQRHPVASQYAVERFITQAISSGPEMNSDSGSEGDDEMSGQESHTAAASEDGGSTTLSSHSSGDMAMDDGRLIFQGPNVSKGLHEDQESRPQTRTDMRDQDGQHCHFCMQTFPSPPAASKRRLGSDCLSPEPCRKCGRSMTYQDYDRDSLRSGETDSQEKRESPFPRVCSTSVANNDEVPDDEVPDDEVPDDEVPDDDATKGNRQSNPKCAYCERRFVNRALRDRHARQCEGNPYRCAQCGKACLGRVKLERHMRSHSRSRLSTLKAQEIARSKQGRAPDPKCAYCQRRFPTRVVRDRHSRLCSSNPYKCPQCGKAFLGMAKLERHVRTHSEVRSSQATGVSTTSHSPVPVNVQASSAQSTVESAVSLTPTLSKSDSSANTRVSGFSHSIESILQMDGP